MNGDEGIDVVFNAEEQEFRLANAATRRDPNWVRVSELLDDDMYRQLRRNLDGSRHADRREARFEKLRRILDYEIPVVRMVDHSFEDAVSAFTRINTLGVRLKKEDIESAPGNKAEWFAREEREGWTAIMSPELGKFVTTQIVGDITKLHSGTERSMN